jgi:hypothetical protein
MTLKITNVNEAPTVELINSLTTIVENVNTTSPIAVATIKVADDGLGSETLTLSGDDADVFEIVGNQLRIKAGTKVDYESTDNQLQVTVNVDDASIGTSPDDTAELSIQVTDVNEAPTLVVQPITPSLPETASTTADRTVANVFVNDDALGTNTLSLSGFDAFSFKLVGTQLQLKAGAKLDFETKTSLSVSVLLNDPTVGGTPDASFNFRLAITDVNEPPLVAPRTFSIPTRSRPGTVVGTVTATDQDTGQTLRYSIVGGNTNSAFAINATTGQIVVAKLLPLRQPGVFKLTVRATDDGAPATFGQGVITINVGSASVTAPATSKPQPAALSAAKSVTPQVASPSPTSVGQTTKPKKAETATVAPPTTASLLSRALTAVKPKTAAKK